MSAPDEATIPMVEQEEAEAEVALDSDFVFNAPHFSVGSKRPYEDGIQDGTLAMNPTAADPEGFGLTNAPPAKKSRSMPGARRGKWTPAEQVRAHAAESLPRPPARPVSPCVVCVWGGVLVIWPARHVPHF